MNNKRATKLIEHSSWVFIEDTPASGKAYYNEDLDMAKVVYRDRTNLFYDRWLNHGRYAASFGEKVRVVNNV